MLSENYLLYDSLDSFYITILSVRSW